MAELTHPSRSTLTGHGAIVLRTLCVALLAGAATATAAGCAPPDEPDRAGPAGMPGLPGMAGMAGMAGTVVAGIGGARRPVAPEVLPPESLPPKSPLPPASPSPGESPPRPAPTPPPKQPVQLPPGAPPSPAQPTVITHVMAVHLTEVAGDSPPADAERQVGLAELSRGIDDIIGRLDRFVEESLRLQQSLLRLRWRPRQVEPSRPETETPDLAELPVGL